jgi:hypothetical protein
MLVICNSTEPPPDVKFTLEPDVPVLEKFVTTVVRAKTTPRVKFALGKAVRLGITTPVGTSRVTEPEAANKCR